VIQKTQEKNGYGITKFSVDHNHSTGKVRGILCSTCNRGLGYFKTDIQEAKLLLLAANYIRKNIETSKDKS
jgi:hypothetical protein